MLADAGARLVIVGHSERSENFGESDADVKAKAEAGLAAGLSVILCVGEPRAVRESGDAIDHVLAQVRQSLPDGFDRSRMAIAYEPNWAIGTGLVATTEDVAAIHGAILSASLQRMSGGAGRQDGSDAKGLLGRGRLGYY